MALNDFYKGETKKFSVAITYNGSAPNITGDAVDIYFKDNITDTLYALSASADVTSSGSTGIAKFNITDTETGTLNSEVYNYKIVWSLGSGETYILDQDAVRVKETI